MHLQHERALRDLHLASLTDFDTRARAVSAIDRARTAALDAYAVGCHANELCAASGDADVPEHLVNDHAIGTMLRAITTLAESAYSTLEGLQSAMQEKGEALGEQPPPWARWDEARTREQVAASLETARGYVARLEAELAAFDSQEDD